MEGNYIIISSKQYDRLVELGILKPEKRSLLKRIISFIKRLK
jgi:hypothetical protein